MNKETEDIENAILDIDFLWLDELVWLEFLWEYEWSNFSFVLAMGLTSTEFPLYDDIYPRNRKGIKRDKR